MKMTALDKADNPEQTAHGGRPNVGTLGATGEQKANLHKSIRRSIKRLNSDPQ